MTTPRKRKTARHYFRFTLTTATGDTKTIIAKAKVHIPKRAAVLTLSADNVRRSMKAKGVGNTQTCSMAMCSLAHKAAFSHQVVGFVDWFYRRAYVASKIGADGLPSECYVYDHHDEMAHLNDTKGGQQKLLQMLEADGDRIIRLHPPTRAPHRPGRARGQNTGERSQPRGAKLRSAVAQLGGV